MGAPNIVEAVEAAHEHGPQRQLLREVLCTLKPGLQKLVGPNSADDMVKMGQVLDELGMQWRCSDGLQSGVEYTATLPDNRELVMVRHSDETWAHWVEPVKPPAYCELCALELEGRSWNKMHLGCAWTTWINGGDDGNVRTAIRRLALLIVPPAIGITWLLNWLGWIGD